MFKKCRKLIIFVLCFVLVFGNVIAVPAQAKGTKGKITVTYKGKTVTVLDSKTKKKGCVSPSKLNKVFGKSGDYTDSNTKIIYRAWNKGKSRIEVTESYGWYGLGIFIKDKNISLCGVKVGMSKSKAVKILKKTFGADAVTATDKKIEVEDPFGYGLITYKLKSGKVTYAEYGHS
jgi:hypothetical protein